MRSKKLIYFLIIFFLSPVLLFASNSNGEHTMLHLMTILVFQIGIIIGPYMLGGISLPGFEGGFFPVQAGSTIPISPELYGIATIASILLLFVAGLETDIKLLIKYSFTGSVVGIGGLVVSYFFGAYVMGLSLSKTDITDTLQEILHPVQQFFVVRPAGRNHLEVKVLY